MFGRIASVCCCHHKRIVPSSEPGVMDFMCASCGRTWVIRRSDIRDTPNSIRVRMLTMEGRYELGRLLSQGILPPA